MTVAAAGGCGPVRKDVSGDVRPAKGPDAAVTSAGNAACREAPGPATACTPCKKGALSVWGVHNPLVAGETFSVNVQVKSLDGGQLTGARVCVTDDAGLVCGYVEPRLAADGLSGQGVLELHAPETGGPCMWRVVLEVAGAAVASRPLPLSVTPALARQAWVRVVDAKSGEPLANASAFFYNDDLARVRPIEAVSDAEGWARALIVAGVSHSVRVECAGHDEGTCALSAGAADEPVQAQVVLEQSEPEDAALLVPLPGARLGR